MGIRRVPHRTHTPILRYIFKVMSTRSIARTADVSRNTDLKFIVDAGREFAAYQDQSLRDLR